jgi:aldose 1-epimerase
MQPKLLRRSLLLLLLPLLAGAAPRYLAEKTTDHGVEVIHLTDSVRSVEIGVVPSVGDRVYEFRIKGKNILYFPTDVGAFKASGGKAFNGIPVLMPWANRMAGGGFWANNNWYPFNGKLGTVRLGQGDIAMHGMLTASPYWKVTAVKADRKSAYVTTRLEFWKYPNMMANWPFAQEYEITYRLTDGALEVSTTVMNLSTEPMPISIGYHPYFNVPDVPRAETTIHIAARKHVETDAHLVATGEMKPNTLPAEVSLRDHTFDDGFTDLIRGENQRATFSVQGGGKKIEVIYGPKFQVAVVYAPPKQNYVCFEPMAAITNGVNLAHEGKYPALQMVAPGEQWQESFWVRGSGF